MENYRKEYEPIGEEEKEIVDSEEAPHWAAKMVMDKGNGSVCDRKRSGRSSESG